LDLPARLFLPFQTRLNKLLATKSCRFTPSFLSSRVTINWVEMPERESIPGNQQRAKAAHPFKSRHHIHHGVLQRMTHVQRAGDVWRWNYDGNAGAFSSRLFPAQNSLLLPALVVVLFSLFGIVLFGNFH